MIPSGAWEAWRPAAIPAALSIRYRKAESFRATLSPRCSRTALAALASFLAHPAGIANYVDRPLAPLAGSTCFFHLRASVAHAELAACATRASNATMRNSRANFVQDPINAVAVV